MRPPTGTSHAAALVVGVAFGVWSCSDDDGGSTPSASERQMNVLALEGDSDRGEGVFAETCGDAACHGSDGDSGPAPDFSQTARQFSDRIIAGIVLNGFNEMPAQSHLSDQEIADVLAWIDETYRAD